MVTRFRAALDRLDPSPRLLSAGIVVFCLMLIAAIAFAVTERSAFEREQTLQDALRQNTILAAAFEQYSLRILRSAGAVTQLVESTYLRLGPGPELASLLADRVAANDFLEVIAVFDARGQLVAASQRRTPPDVNIADREEFLVHVSGTGPILHVGRPGATPLWHEAALPITRRIARANGEFGGVVMTLIRPQRFTSFYEDAAVQSGDVVVLAGLDGITRAQKIGGRDSFAEDLNFSPLLQQWARQGKGVYRGTTRGDGVIRLHAFRTMTGFPLVVIVANSQDQVLVEFSERDSLYYMGAIAAGVLIVLFALVVIAAIVRAANAAKALAESEGRFRALTALSADWWWEQDAELIFTHVAGDARSRAGILAEDFLGRRRWESPSVKPVNTTWDAHRALLEARLPFANLLMEYTDSNGGRHFTNTSGGPIVDTDGKFRGYRGVASDVTAKIATERALQESEARFRTLIELSADWWWEQDAEFRFVDITGLVSPQANKFEDEFLGRCRWEVSRLEPVNTTWELHRAALETYQPYGNLLMKYTDSDGAVHFEVVTGKPLFDAQGKFSGYRGVGSNVTQKMEVERALQQSEARFRHLAELSADWYWEQDDQFRFTFFSQGYQRITGVENATRIGKTRWEYGLLGLTEAQWLEHRRQLDAHTPFRNLECQSITNDGRVCHISVSGDPVFDETGRFTGYRGTGTDITQRKLVEAEVLALNATLEEHVLQRTEQLEAANDDLRALGYSIAHDMRAPLRAIGGFSQMLLENHLPQIGAEGKVLFSRILTNVEWMGHLIDGLLALSQLSMAPVSRKPVDLTALSREIFDELQRLEPGRPVELVLEDALVVEGDNIMVRRMMQNLIGNAWKYSANEPLARIEIGSLKGSNGASTYFIKDNGAGFDMTYADKLFQPFQRLHSPSEFQGSGIGLAIISLIVRKHGGQIHAEAAVGRGAAFYFTFPHEGLT